MRSISALPLALVALLLVAPVAIAGNWAAVSVDSSSTDGWEAGTSHGLVVTLLQHGETPVNHGSVEVALTNDVTGASITGVARRVGDGLWQATLALPSDGDWALSVSHSTLATELNTPVTISVAPSPAPTPAPSSALLSPALLLAMAATVLFALAVIAGLLVARSRPGVGHVSARPSRRSRLDATQGPMG